MAERRPLVLVNGKVKEMPSGDGLPPDVGGSSDPNRYMTYSRSGELAVETGSMRLYLPMSGTITDVSYSVGISPVGASVAASVILNGSTQINTPASYYIAAGQYKIEETGLSQAVVAGDYLTVNITGVGVSVPGSDLVVVVKMAPA